MSYIEDKISAYVEMEYLLEFNSPEECMKYFNTYDCQNFKTVEEMKEYQGKYGFGFNGKWYHINIDDALDILECLGIKEQFTDDELYMLSDGVLAIIRNVDEALKLVCDAKSIDALQETKRKYIDLNVKIYKMMK